MCQGFPLWNSALLPILALVSAVSTGMAAVLLVGVFYAPDEFNEVVVMKKFHFGCPSSSSCWLPRCCSSRRSTRAPPAGRAGCRWWRQLGRRVLALLFVIVGLVLPDDSGMLDAVGWPSTSSRPRARAR